MAESDQGLSIGGGTSLIASFVKDSTQSEVLTQTWTLSFAEEAVENEYVVFAHNSFWTLFIFLIGHAVGILSAVVVRSYGWEPYIFLISAVAVVLAILAVVCYFLCVRTPPTQDFSWALRRAKRLEVLAFLHCSLACVYAFVPYLIAHSCAKHYVDDEGWREEDAVARCYNHIFAFIYAFSILPQLACLVRSKYEVPLHFFWQCIRFALRPLSPKDTTSILVSQIILNFSFTVMVSAIQIFLEIKTRKAFADFAKMKRSAALANDLSKSLQAALDVCLPSTVVERLYAGRPVVDYSSHCTYAACMFHDFAQWTTKLLVGDAVLSVSLLYAAFDRLCTLHHAEKVKMHGDQYEFALGLRASHCECQSADIDQAVRIAFMMHKYAKTLHHFGIEVLPWLQVGIHTAAAFGAIVDANSLVYDSFGPSPSAARSAARQCPPGATVISAKSLCGSECLKEGTLIASASQIHIENAGDFMIVKINALHKDRFRERVVQQAGDGGELKVMTTRPLSSLSATTKKFLHSIFVKVNPEAAQALSQNLFGHDVLDDAQRRLQTFVTSCTAPLGAFSDENTQKDYDKFLWGHGERSEGCTAMVGIGLVIIVQFFSLFIEDSEQPVALRIVLLIVAASFIVNGAIRRLFCVHHSLQAVSQLLFLCFFFVIGSLNVCLLNRDLMYISFVFCSAPLIGTSRLPFVLSSVLYLLIFFVTEGIVTYALIDGGVQSVPVFIVANMAVLVAALASDYSRKAADAVAFHNWTTTQAALQAANDEKLVLQTLLEMAVPKEFAPIVLERKEEATSYVKFRDDMVVVQLRHDSLLQQVAFSALDENYFEVVHLIEKRNSDIAQVMGRMKLLHVVTVSGDTTLVAGPLGAIDEATKETKDGSGNSNVVLKQGDEIVFAAAEAFCVFQALQQLFGKSITTLGGIGSAIESFFGFQGISFGLMGPVIREIGALTEAAPPSFQGVTDAFMRAIEVGNVKYQQYVRFLPATHWRVRGVGSVTIHPVQPIIEVATM